MLLAALVDAGCPLEVVRDAVGACGVDEVRLDVREVSRAGIRGLQLDVAGAGDGPARDLPACLAAVAGSGLPEPVRRRAGAVLERLGEAEARVHGLPAGERVHLHELSGADLLVDVVGVCAALAHLEVTEVWASPVPASPGTVVTEHGELPLPAPATLTMLAEAGAPLLPGTAGLEEVTPTAAALLTVLARFGTPPMRLLRVGHGAGTRDLPHRPNVVRCWLGEPLPGSTAGWAGQPGEGTCVELRANLDDASPAVVAHLAERCLAAGALDAWVVASTMKKGRPGHVLHLLATTGQEDALARLLLEQSPTLGVRATAARRWVAGREVVAFASPLGEVRVKRKLLGGRAVDARPELDDCRRIALETGRPLHQVVDTITAAARAALVDEETP